MKKKIYIIVRSSRSTSYGIGTYQANLIKCLKQSGIECGVIEFHSLVYEIVIKQQDGYEMICIPSKNSDNNAQQAEYYSRNLVYILREIIPDDRTYDLIFHINVMDNHILVKYLKKLFKCKVILTIHYSNWSFELLGNTKKLDDILIRKKRQLNNNEQKIRMEFERDMKMAQRCDQVIYIADHSANTLSKYLKAKNTIIINNGLEDTYKELSPERRNLIRAKYFIAPETKVVVFAGRLDEVKGVKYLIRAFRKVLLDYSDILLVIAGDGEFQTLFKEADAMWSKVILTGKIEKAKLYELFEIANLGVVSSIHEEFGYVAVEMMMHSLPVIVSNTGGLAEIVEDGVSGLKIPVITRNGQRGINTKLLASKISLLLEDSDLVAILRKGARKIFLEKYELSVFKKNIVSLYNNT